MSSERKLLDGATEIRYGRFVARTWSSSLEDDEWIVTTEDRVVEFGISRFRALKLAQRLSRADRA